MIDGVEKRLQVAIQHVAVLPLHKQLPVHLRDGIVRAPAGPEPVGVVIEGRLVNRSMPSADFCPVTPAIAGRGAPRSRGTPCRTDSRAARKRQSGPPCPLRSHSPGKNTVLPRTIAPFTCRAKSNGLSSMRDALRDGFAFFKAAITAGQSLCCASSPSPDGLIWDSCPSTCGFRISFFQRLGRPRHLGFC
jgi:hypothetical protein